MVLVWLGGWLVRLGIIMQSLSRWVPVSPRARLGLRWAIPFLEINQIIGNKSWLPFQNIKMTSLFSFFFVKIEIMTSSVSLLNFVPVLKVSLAIFSSMVSFILFSKIITRNHLHTVFNLGMSFFFLWSSIFSPLTIYEYGNLLEEVLQQSNTGRSTICHRIHLYRVFLMQATKVALVNVVFRYII